MESGWGKSRRRRRGGRVGTRRREIGIEEER